MEFGKDSIFNQKFPFESDIIDMKKYFSEYAELLIPFEICQNEKCKNEAGSCEKEDCKANSFYTKFLDISKEQLQELKERTSVDLLKCNEEVEPMSLDFYKKLSEENVKELPKEKEDKVLESSLLSVKRHQEISDIFKSELPRGFFKYCNYQWCLSNDKNLKRQLDFQSADFSTIVACVKVYYPFLSNHNNTAKIKLLQELHVLGSQTLSQLKDKIICSIDYIGSKDVSSECYLKDVGLNTTDKDEYPSSFIFIENTFYNDTRSSKMVDLSEEIREWGISHGLGPFDCKSMEDAKICDLKLKIGRPYVYMHQGSCEHLIVFSDIRFTELSDPAKETSYPKTHCTGRIYGKHCMMCADSYARWLVIGNERLTHDKTYLCKKCFLSYNYVDGQKIGQFEAYKYVDPVAIL